MSVSDVKSAVNVPTADTNISNSMTMALAVAKRRNRVNKTNPVSAMSSTSPSSNQLQQPPPPKEKERESGTSVHNRINHAIACKPNQEQQPTMNVGVCLPQ